MAPNQTTTQGANRQITDDMTVFGADGDKLGTVRNYDPEAGYVDIQKGWLFHKDFYVGLAAITSVDEHGITLNLIKDDLKDDRFAAPPMRGGFAYSGSVVPTDTSPSGEKDPAGDEGDVKTPPPSGTVY